jgi:tRNA threonylcarbamoyladenosine biosynthesis protein TsaB
MLVLALDCSTRTGSIALSLDGRLLESRVGDAAVRQAVRLPGDLVRLLGAQGYTLHDVDLLAVAAGPGGFTGLRVGLATVQGLAMALDRRVFVAPTLDVLAVAARAAAPADAWIGVWMQGMRGEVFTALYPPRGGDVGMEAAGGPWVGAADDGAQVWAASCGDATIAVIGDAWPDAAAPLVARFGDRLRACEAPPLAETLARLAFDHADLAVAPAAVRPAYVRRPDAVVLREQAGLPVTADP